MIEENTNLGWRNRTEKHAADADIARRRLIALSQESGLPFDELLELWADDTEQQLEAASAALGVGNLIEAARLVHSASGASGICGVDALASQLKIVETLAVLGRRQDARQALEQAQIRFACLSGALLNGARS